MRIGLLLGRSFTDERHMAAVVRLLAERGATATPLHLGDALIDVARVRLDYDLYVLKSRSDLAMSVAADLHRAGAALLNPYPVSALLRDRIVMQRVLRAAGIPVPETFVASHVSQLLPALDQGPLILRRHRRSGKRGVVWIVSDAAELAAVEPLDEPVFAQRYHPPDDGRERHISSVGGELVGVERVHDSAASRDSPFTVSGELAELARRVGAAFGIDLFGIHVVESGGQPYVVDVSAFPSLKGVPDAPARLAQHIHTAAQRAMAGGPAVKAEGGGGRERRRRERTSGGTAVDLVLRALSRAPATERELEQIEKLIAEIRTRGEPAHPSQRVARAADDGAVDTSLQPPRVAMYSQGMMGFGHIRRNASIAQALRASALQPAIVMIAEAWQAGALPMPPGVDCVTLPAIRREPDGAYNPRFLLDVSDRELVKLRAGVIRSAMDAFAPDVLVVDYLPLGVANELAGTLRRLRERGTTRCVLGLREVLQDRETVERSWCDPANLDAIRDLYDAIWIYGDPRVFDPVRQYGLPDHVAAKVSFTGYIDQRPRLEFAGAAGALLANLPPPPARLALCLVGGGHDGSALAEAFLQAELPPDTTGVVVTGPLMPGAKRQHMLRRVHGHSRYRVLEFVSDPTPLIERADRVITMGGYNSMCEVLSFEKHALVVPRVHPEPEQWIRAERLRELGLVALLHPDELTPAALSEWLARDLGPAPRSRSCVDLGGLDRIPGLLAELLAHPAGVAPPVRASA